MILTKYPDLNSIKRHPAHKNLLGNHSANPSITEISIYPKHYSSSVSPTLASIKSKTLKYPSVKAPLPPLLTSFE